MSPPAMPGAVRVAVACTTYAPVHVPFGCHQAPGLVQHLIAAVLSELRNTRVVIVRSLDDILFVGRDRLITTQLARDTAAHLALKHFLVSSSQSSMPRWGSSSVWISLMWHMSPKD